MARRVPKQFRKFYERVGGELRRKETSIERKTREMLRDIGVPFEQEKVVEHLGRRRAFDFFVYRPDGCALLIECHGDWTHYSDEYRDSLGRRRKPSKWQKRAMRNDRVKEGMARALGIPLVVLWEREINSDPGICRKRIIDEIERQNNAVQGQE